MLRLHWATMAAVIFGTAGCFAQGDPSNPVGATLTEGRATLVSTLCEGEGVRSVFLTDSASQDGEGPILWRIDASGRPVRREVFVVGEVPEGFVESTPLEAGVPLREVTAWVRTDSDVEMVGAVKFGEVEEGKLYVDSKPVSPAGFREQRFCS